MREKRASPPYYIWLSRSLVRRRLWGPGDPSTLDYMYMVDVFQNLLPNTESSGLCQSRSSPYGPPKSLSIFIHIFSPLFFHYPLLSAVRGQSWPDGTYSMAWLRAPVDCRPLASLRRSHKITQNGLAPFHLPLLSAHCRTGNRLGARSALLQGHTHTHSDSDLSG